MARYCFIVYCRWSRRAHSVAWLGSVTWLSESSDAVGPSASVTVDDEFKAVPGHSFLTLLRCPQPATIARKRKVAFNPPPHGKWRSDQRHTVFAQHGTTQYTDTTCTRNSGMCVCRPRLNNVFQKFHLQEWFTVGLLAEPDSKLILPSSFIYPR